MKHRRTELEVENHLIEVLGEGHNQWNYRPDLKSEEDLWQNLRQKITQNNLAAIGETPLTDKEFEAVKIDLLSKTKTPFDAAKWLKGENGISRITIEREDASLGSLSLVLYSNKDIGGGRSSYEVVHQIATKGKDGTRDRRFDVTLLINGLPIIQIELKQVAAKDGVYQAFEQIKKYAEEGKFTNNIFSTLQLFVVSNEQTTRYFANANPKDMNRKFLFSWRTTDNKKVDSIYEFCKQVLNIPEAHRLVADYMIASEDQDNKVLMVLHPYQIHAIEALFNSAKKHESGYVWHATGSGKTLTSFVSTKLLAQKPGIDRTIMLVDRQDLDNQTTNEFTKFASEYNTGISSGNMRANSLIVGTGSSRELAETLLSDSNSNVVIITTRQKLEAALKHAAKLEEQRGTNKFEKIRGQHIVFVVDECHRALSSEGMQKIKNYFPNSTWFGFTGTPIFEVNKKQGKGSLARTTPDQYGKQLHAYTIKNALEDNAVLGFQVEHEDTIEQLSLQNRLYDILRVKYPDESPEDINQRIDDMTGIEKETYLEPSVYETDEHIKEVIKKILRPDNAYTKFDFKNGRPTKSAILTTSSIDMAKRYYHAFMALKQDPELREELLSEHPVRQGRTMNDPDFPRVAITYSLNENVDNSNEKQKEMENIIKDYNKVYGTSWDLSTIDRYNGDINNRLAKKRAEFKEFGKQVDLVIVVDRLLTGFDAPTIQTLFVDRNLQYAGLIQAFSRTNRTFPGKKKGMIVTFRKPNTMEENVSEATRLYSQSTEDSDLVYPTYKESKKKFEKASENFTQILKAHEEIDENSDDATKVEYVKNYQQLANAYEALVTYDEYNNEIEESEELQEQLEVLEKELGNYMNVKQSLIIDEEGDEDEEENEGNEKPDLSEINFYSDSQANLYDIDSLYIDQLLGSYEANSTTVREEIENALAKLNKPESVRKVYRSILDAMDKETSDVRDDIFSIKREYFTEAKNDAIYKFSRYWCVSEEELHLSAMQYRIGENEVSNLAAISKSGDYATFKTQQPDIKLLRYRQLLKTSWSELLDKEIGPLEEELR